MTHTASPTLSGPGSGSLQEWLKHTLIEGTFGALVRFDLDRFHQFNVEHGVSRGDQVLETVQKHVTSCGWACFRITGDEFGVGVEETAEPFSDVEFKTGLQDALRQIGTEGITFSGGGVWHPGPDFGRDPRMAEVLVDTAGRLLEVARAEGGDRLVWLPPRPVDSPALMEIMVRFYAELARISGRLAHELAIEARVDYLTGLANRRGFEDEFRRMIDGARRSGRPLALLYMDSDSLKQINDTQGHDAGDRFIQDIAQVLRQVVRGSDFISRWGADEFAVLLADTNADKAAVLARRIQQAVETRTEGTVSIGVYCGVPESAEEAIQRADRALYRAKEQGKNRVVFAAE